MTERKKIINIIEQNKYCDVNTSANCRECKYGKELENYKDMGCSSLKTADALVAAGFISLKTSADMAREACDILRHIKDDEIKCICEERDALARRTEVAERALRDITEVLPCSVCPYGYDGFSRQCDLDTGTCLENCLRIAEGKLAEGK